MKILINEKQLSILVEQNQPKIYNRPGDPYEYKFQNNTWFARKKGTDGQFLDITKYQKSIDILNKEFPQGKVQTTKKIEQPQKKETKNLSNEKISLESDPLFQKKLEEVAKNLGFQKEWLLKIMEKESLMNPKEINSIGCVGLIQFCPDNPRGTFKTIGGKKYDLEEVRNMSATQQLVLVQEFFKPHASKIKSYEDLYFFTFYPYAFGKPEDFVIGSDKGPKYALKLSQQNSPIAKAAGKTPGVDTLTVADFRKYLKT